MGGVITAKLVSAVLSLLPDEAAADPPEGRHDYLPTRLKYGRGAVSLRCCDETGAMVPPCMRCQLHNVLQTLHDSDCSATARFR